MPQTLPLIVRDAQETDYLAIKALYQELFAQLVEMYPKQYRPKASEVGLKQDTFLDTLVSENWAYLVAEVEGKVVGSMQLSIDQEEQSEYRNAQEYVWIEDLLVSENEPHKDQVTSALLLAAERWAGQHEISLIDSIIYSFHPSFKAIAEKKGFEVVSTRMRKQITIAQDFPS